MLGLTALCLIVSVTANGQDVSPADASSKAGAPGRRSFESHCAACHGLDGQGGEHAPGIARDSAAMTLSDQALFGIIHNGIPAKGMPGFGSLGHDEITAIVAYLRRLEGKVASKAVAGDPERGEELFFGKAGCANCHAVKGRGHYIASDLSDSASQHSPGEIRDAILKPRAPEHPLESAKVVTRDGRTLSGVIRNEDNFSLQLQGAEGQFYLLVKSAVARIDRTPGPAMPRDYKERLSPNELDDVVGYIARQAPAGGSTPAADATTRVKRP